MGVSALTVAECPGDGRDFEQVLRLLKLAKSTVGFLPDSAVRDRAERGTLIVAHDGVGIVGYVLFDLPRDEIRLVQLVVDPRARRAGVAKVLVGEVARRNPARRGMSLHCRRDFEASKVWPRLGFVPIAERSGRSADGKPLTMWWKDFQQPNLLWHLAASDERPLAAVDANVVIDLADARRTPSAYLRNDWLAAACRLGVTDETYLEFERHDDDAVRRAHKEFARRLEQIQASESVWRPLESSMREELGGRARTYEADLRHAAKAAAGRARWFVTRDEPFRRACEHVVWQICDVRVVSPTGLIREVDQLARGDTYRPADLVGSEIIVRALEALDIDRAAREFANQRNGERFRSLRSRINELAADTLNNQFVLFEEGADLLGLVAVEHGSFDQVSICRVRADLRRQTIARHMLAWVRSLSDKSRAIVLSDDGCGDTVTQAATREGFLPASTGQTAFAVSGSGSHRRLEEEVEQLAAALPPGLRPDEVTSTRYAEAPGAAALLRLEKVFAPYWVLDRSIQTFVIPIKPGWAAELVDPAMSRSQLFPRSVALALQREHVYYRSPRASAGLRAPARLLWYVSDARRGGGSIRAVSHLDEVVVGDARRLHRRFAHLGVYSQAQVINAAVDGNVMALRFSNTRPLRQPVSFDHYRRLVQDHRPGKGVAVAGPQPVDEHTCAAIATISG